MNGSPALLCPNDFHEPANAEFQIGAWLHFEKMMPIEIDQP
jgi:hypothetical protein